MAWTHAAVEVAQQAVLQTVDQPMHPDFRAARPGSLQDRRLADPADAFDHVELGQPVALRLRSGWRLRSTA